MIRERMSRPRWSVPSQNVPGATLALPANAVPGFWNGMSVAVGVNGETSGANRAAATQKRTRLAPSIPTQLSRRRPKDRRARAKAVPVVGAGTAKVVACAIRDPFRLSEPDARIEVGIADVGQRLGADGHEYC